MLAIQLGNFFELALGAVSFSLSLDLGRHHADWDIYWRYHRLGNGRLFWLTNDCEGLWELEGPFFKFMLARD